MSKKFEILVNGQFDGNVTLARIRGVSNAKTLKFTNEQQLRKLGKGDGAVVQFDGLVEKGNYLVPTNCKVIETHISGKAVDVDAYLASLEETAPASTPF